MNQPTDNSAPVIDLQIATADDNVPSEEQFTQWVAATLPDDMLFSEVTIRLVSAEESQQLNQEYRGKGYPTNVLSFPSGLPDGLDVPFLGDLVVCVAVVEKEAMEQSKALDAHWAHLVVHGVLHLLGFDHIEDKEAEKMESLEIDIMRTLGFSNPYEQI